MVKEVTIKIRNNETKEVVEISDKVGIHPDGEPDVSLWRIGRFACDCLRGKMAGDGDEVPCGHFKYSLEIYEGDKCIYEEP